MFLKLAALDSTQLYHQSVAITNINRKFYTSHQSQATTTSPGRQLNAVTTSPTGASRQGEVREAHHHQKNPRHRMVRKVSISTKTSQLIQLTPVQKQGRETRRHQKRARTPARCERARRPETLPAPDALSTADDRRDRRVGLAADHRLTVSGRPSAECVDQKHSEPKRAQVRDEACPGGVKGAA